MTPTEAVPKETQTKETERQRKERMGRMNDEMNEDALYDSTAGECHGDW